MTPRTTPSDNDLVRRIREGEGAAVASLRARHWAAVFDFSLRMTASVEVAREISDAVFDQLVDEPPGPDAGFLPWALAAAHRRVMAQSERLPARSVDLTDDIEIVVDLREESEPIDETLALQVWDAMTRLDRQTQAVIDLHLRQGLDASELAPILGMSNREAAAAVQQMKRAAAESIAVELLRSDDTHECEALEGAYRDGSAGEHISDCATCLERRSVRYSPLQILAALRVVPAVPVDLPGAAESTAGRRLATPFGVLAAVIGAVAVVLVGVLAWNGIFGRIGDGTVDAAGPDPVTTTSAPTTSPPTVVVAAQPDFAGTEEDVAVAIPVLANDAAGRTAEGRLSILTPPTHGVATVTGDLVRYEPEADYAGTDSFEYRLVDAAGAVTTARVDVSIEPVDDAPVAIRRSPLAATEDEALTIDLDAWVADVDGDPIEIVAFDEASDGGGSVTGDLVYTPAQDFNGIDSFGLIVTDGTTELALSILLDVAAVNDAPLGPRRLTLETNEDVAVVFDSLEDWADVDGDDLVILLESFTTEAGGTLDTAGIRITYLPAPDFSGEDTFFYRVSDGVITVPVAVDLSVAPIADPPTVTRSSFSVPEDTPVGTRIGNLAATDPEGDSFSFRLREPSNAIAMSSGGAIDLLRSLDFESATRLSVGAVVVDETGAETTFDIVLRVSDVDEAPTGDDQQLLVTPFAPQGTKIGTVVVVDPEGETLTFQELNGDPAGAVTVSKTGVVRTTRDAEPVLYPLTIAIEAADPGGQSTVVLVVVRLNDFQGPDVGAVSVSHEVVWEQASNGGGCPQGPSRSDISVPVFDSSGISSATIEWSAVFDGLPLSGATRMAVSGGAATGSFSFGSGLVEPGGESLLTASILVVDRAGNPTRSDPFEIVVMSCAG